MPVELSWLPILPQWDASLEALQALPSDAARWSELLRLSRCRIDFIQTGRLDRAAQRLFGHGLPSALGVKPLRVALLGSATLRHLLPGIRIGALRRGLRLEVYEGPYGMYQQELLDSASDLYKFRPDVVCLSLDARHLAEGGRCDVDGAIKNLRECWELARRNLGCAVIQQTALPVLPNLLGNNDHRSADSPQAFLRRFNFALQRAADEAGVHLLSVDQYAAIDGLHEWHDPTLWHRAKQEIHPRVSHLYGDLLGRVLAALHGQSRKCLVLDLDNTLWGGVIGDDGLPGIVLGQGSALGEAYTAFQRYLLQMAGRGIILAVCSKNDEANALAPFASSPEMLISRKDIACFVANWDDKASNLRRIAKELNIGLDSLVFVDDSPFEREFVRQQLPEVAVPELPEDPSLFISCLDSAGYFESLSITDEDRHRVAQYQANAERENLRGSSGDLAGYLGSLSMELFWKAFDAVGLSRIVQLINKTNQFNLTTRRYTDADVLQKMSEPATRTYQLRLTDRFGDNGIIAIVIGTLDSARDFQIDTWLMSCRVLGRTVEEATLNIVVAGARAAGARRVVGEYQPTAKNGMVRDLYQRLGFAADGELADGGSRWVLDISSFEPRTTYAKITEGTDAGPGDLQPANPGISRHL